MHMKQQTGPENPSVVHQSEMEWYANVYQGDRMPQLTIRAVVMGSLLGGFMSLSNLYVGLKTGWGLGVAITSCILSFAIWKALHTLLPKIFKTEMSILENNCMQSTASSAGYSTGGTMVSAIAAYLMVTGQHMPGAVLAMWTLALAALGVFMAVPLKRQMINIEQLKFPSGIAAAETLKSLHSKGEDSNKKAKALGISGFFGGVVAWLRDAGKPFAIPGHLEIPGVLGGFPLAKWTISFEMSAIMIAAGSIIGWRVAWSLMVGASINYLWLAPKMVELGAISAEKLGYRAIVGWSTWAGASLMVTSGLTAFAMQWRTIARALSGVTKIFNKEQSQGDDPLGAIEVPSSWFLLGTLISGGACVAILYFYFDTSVWMGCLAVALTFFLGIVACRATGESDITPIGAMGKVTQLSFGALAPANVTANLMTAAVTAGAAGSSADLLTDLKSGYLLGANPRKQFIAQFLGIFAGTLVVVPAFYLLVPTAASLGTDQWPAPAAQTWKAVADLLAKGVHALHPTAQLGILVGGLIGVILPMVEALAPSKLKRFIPSATGIGLSMVIPFFNSLGMFIGALFALVLEKLLPKIAADYVVPVASGVIAGESIMGIIVALLAATGVL
jgi:OPT family oligopeptide transporter